MVIRLDVDLERVSTSEDLRKEVAQQVMQQAGVEGMLALAEAMGNPGYQDWLEANRKCYVAGKEVPPRVASIVQLAGGEVTIADPAPEEALEAFRVKQARKRGRKPAPWGGDSDTDSQDQADDSEELG